MVYEFADEWPDEIAEVSTTREFQNARVTLVNPDAVTLGDYNYETGERPVFTNGVAWQGWARIIGVRAGANRLNEDTWNADTQTTIRVQFPARAVGRVRRGMVLTVDECALNPVLTEMVFTAMSDLQGSNAAARTIQFSTSSDAEVADAS